MKKKSSDNDLINSEDSKWFKKMEKEFKKKISIKVPKELAIKLEKAAKETNKDIGTILEEAIDLFKTITEYKARGFKPVAKGPFKIEKPL